MLRLTGFVMAVAACITLAGEDEIPPHILNLARIQLSMAGQLKRQPNYTCLETIDRYAGETRMKALDRIRLQVAIVGGKEMHSWPGAGTFDERPLTDLVRTGFMSDGDFAAMARNLFTGRTATVTFAGPETVNGRGLLRYEFRISQMLSGWTVRQGNASGTVGVAGSFWADAVSYDLVRMSFVAEDLPPFSTDKTLKEDVTYSRVQLGSSEILLPFSVDISSEAFNGDHHWNHETFTACRQYSAESSISFGEEDPTLTRRAGSSAPEWAVTIPAGHQIQLRLENAIDSARAAVGDEIRASVVKDVRVDGVPVAERGAVAEGVIRVFEAHTGTRPYFEVALEFNTIDSRRGRSVFVAQLDRVSAFPGFNGNAAGYAETDPPRSFGVGYFYVEGTEVRIPAGTVLSWTTRELVSH